MTHDSDSPYEALEKIFHEPNRMAIVSAVCAANKGVRFPELKDTCGLTDGNLNRHLKVLQEAGVVRIEKAFIKEKPCTTVHMTRAGLDRFHEYLSALADVLKAAEAALPKSVAKRPVAARPVTA